MKNFAQEMATVLSPACSPQVNDVASDSTLAGFNKTLRGSGSSSVNGSSKSFILSGQQKMNNLLNGSGIQVMMTTFEKQGLAPVTKKERQLEEQEKKMQFQKLLNQVKGASVNTNLALRSNRASVHDAAQSPCLSTDYQKKLSLEKRLRRGRNMHKPYYRTEKERVERELAVMASTQKQSYVDYEDVLGSYPKRFNVAKCLSNERTFPYCVSPSQAATHVKTSGLKSALGNTDTRTLLPDTQQQSGMISTRSDRKEVIHSARTTKTKKMANTTRQKMVSIIDSHTGFETGRTAVDSSAHKNLDLTDLSNN